MASEGITLATAYVQLTSSAEGLGKEIIGKVGDAGDKAGKEGGEKAGKSFGQRFTSVLTSGKAIAGGAIVGAVVASVKGLYSVGSVFDDVSDTIRTGTGATGDALDGLVGVAKNVGSTVPSQFDKIGPVVADLNTRLGLSGKTLETVASQYLQAGNILGQDVDINKTTAAFGAFGIKGAEVSDAMDQLFRVSQATGVGMNELATSAQTQGSVFKNLGFSFEDTISFMGSLDKAGVNSQAVMASMSKGLVTLAQDGEDPKQAFARVTDEIGKFIEKGDTAGALNMASKVFGTRGAAQFVGAVQSGTLAVDDLMAATGATSDTILGVADDTADLAESWQVLKNKALLAVQPVASKTFDLLSKGVGKVASGFDGAVKSATDMGKKVVAAVAPIGKSILSSGMEFFSKIFEAAKPGIDALVQALQPFLSALMSVLPALSPVKLIFDAIQPLLPQIGETIGQLAAVIGGALAAVLTSVTPLLTTIGDALGRLMEFVSPLIASLLPPLNDLFAKLAPLLDAVLGILTPIIDAIASALIPAINALMPVVETVFGAVSEIISAAMQVLGGLITFVTGVLSGDWSKAWEGIKQTFSGVWEAIKAILSGAWNVIKSVASAAWNALKGIIMTPVNWVRDQITSVFNGIKAFFGTLWGGIKTGIQADVQLVKGFIINPLKAAYTWVTDTFGKIGGFMSDLWHGIVDKAGDILGGIKSTVSGAFSGIADVIKKPINGIISLINRIAIGGINKLIDGANKVPFVDIPHLKPIPSLARGGVVDIPTLAVVGDAGRGNPEIVAPRKMLLDIMREANRGDARMTGGPLIGEVHVSQPVNPADLARELDRRMAFAGAVR